MKKSITKISIYVVIATILSLFLLTSCSRYITTEQAANGKARCGKWLR